MSYSLGKRAGAGIVLLLISALPACVTSGREAAWQKASSGVRAIARAHPDSVISVLVRTTQEISAQQRGELDRAQFSVGTVLGDVVTGRLRARDVVRVAAVPFVIALELSRDIPVAQPRSPAINQSRSRP